jgi:hypothetical protein
MLFIALLMAACTTHAQKASVAIIDDSYAKGQMDRPTKSLYELLGAQHFSMVFKLPGNKKHELVLVMRSVFKDSTASADTLIDSRKWRRMIVGGAPYDPREESFFIGQRVDSMHYKLLCRFGNMNSTERVIRLPWPNHGYMLDEGLRSRGKAVPMVIGQPIPFMVLTQPYPDPPPPKKAVIYRYCFGVDTPPDQWPEKYGVEHLYVLELTLLP